MLGSKTGRISLSAIRMPLVRRRRRRNRHDDCSVRARSRRFPIIQQWSNDPTGTNKYGFVVQAGWTGQTNGWGLLTNGTATVDNRPKLSVTYTTSPIGVATFQRDLNGYTGDTVVRLSSGADLIIRPMILLLMAARLRVRTIMSMRWIRVRPLICEP